MTLHHSKSVVSLFHTKKEMHNRDATVLIDTMI